MYRQGERFTMTLPVELYAHGQRRALQLHDLSRSGMFLRTTQPLEIGTEIHVAIAPDGQRCVTGGRVTHRLREADARAFGRRPGIGIEFREPNAANDHLFAIAVERLVRARRATTDHECVHVVVADAELRVVQRMSSSLAEAGFSVDVASTGMEALAACLRTRPAVMILDHDLPVPDGMGNGFGVLDAMAHDDRFAGIPIVITSDEPGDIAEAFERGARDFIAKPYGATEVIARVRRLVGKPVAASVRGALACVPLQPLLSMLEQERKSGSLVVTHDDGAYRVELAHGTVIDASSSSDDTLHPRAVLMALLDRAADGSFELCAPAHAAPVDTIAMSITHLLLEHARLSDERSR